MAKWQRVKIPIPKDLKPRQREILAQEVIDFIIERSKNGKDKDGKKFKRYSKQYAEEKGVSRGDVNLTFTDEMLNALIHVNGQSKSGNITVGMPKDDDRNNGVAEGNIKGTYGTKTPDSSKARDFLGIKQSELNKLINKVRKTDTEVASLIRDKALSIADAITLARGDDGDS